MTRSDISYIINNLCQFFAQTIDVHWQTVLRYLNGITSHDFLLKKLDTFDLIGLLDADWAGNVDDRKGISSYGMYLGNSLVSWVSSKKWSHDHIERVNIGLLP